jgi:tRNA pseudouridine13 synthase
VLTSEEREKERQLFEAERKRVPELFLREPMVDDAEFLRWIGIETANPDRPLGYIKLLPQDFIVEEILQDGTLVTVDFGELINNVAAEGKTYYAELVKVGIDTLAAKEEIAAMLAIDAKNIGFAGIKDRLALTGQRISIRNVASGEEFSKVKAENFFLKNIIRGKGAVANGDLKGNRFIILLRLLKELTKEEIAAIEKRVQEVKEDGFWNFFYFQRFGTPRLLSHWLGLLLLRGRYEEVIKTFLTYPAARELPYFKNIRKEIGESWGNWQEIFERLKPFPYHFRHELLFAGYLIEHPTDFLGALHVLPDQVRLWLYAYDCFLFNRKLSELIQKGEVPISLPLITSFNPKDWEPYRKFLEADEVKLPSSSYRDFPFIRVESRDWPTLQKADIHRVVFKKQFAVFAFSLPKGSYATSFLMEFFTLCSGLPFPPGIPTDPADIKEMSGLGTLAPVLERFKPVLEKRIEDIGGGTE